MRIAAQKINSRGIDVSRSKLRMATEKYVKQLGQSCEKLYDLGYLHSPLYYDEDAFMTCLFDEFPEIAVLCRNVTTGRISWSIKQISYVLKAIGESHKAYDALSTAKSAIEAAQALSDFSDFLSKVHFKKKDDLLNCRSSLTVSNRVYSSGKLSLDSPYLRECFYIQPDKHVVEFNYSIEMLRAVLKAIGVDETVTWDSPSLFLGDGFTVCDDCEFLNLLISGDIKGNGKYASRLHEAVEAYYTDYYSNRTTIAECIKYEEQMYLNAINPSIAIINEFRSQHPDYEPFFVDSKRIYWLAQGAVAVRRGIGTDIFIGEDIRYIGSTGVSLMNRLLGFSGQFLYRFDSAISDYEVVGMPVTLYSVGDNGKRVPAEYYPIANLRRKFHDTSLPVTGVGAYMREIFGVGEVCEFLDIECLETLAVEVADLVEVTYKTHPEEFKSLVGLLVQAMVCVMCDYTLDGHESPNHVQLDSTYAWVTEENYLDACAVAESFYEKLGF